MTKIRGHFASLLRRHGDILVPTTLTNARKRTGAAKELAKRQKLLDELQVSPIARRLDGVVRRWNGVRNNGPDG